MYIQLRSLIDVEKATVSFLDISLFFFLQYFIIFPKKISSVSSSNCTKISDILRKDERKLKFTSNIILLP